jgi:preprotein translocase subunit SecG
MTSLAKVTWVFAGLFLLNALELGLLSHTAMGEALADVWSAL